MNKATVTQQTKTTSFVPSHQGFLQRKCACGNHTIAGGECEECTKKKTTLQRKLTIGASNDPLEQEADRVAEQVLSMPTNPGVSRANPNIQRYISQPSAQSEEVPASVDRVLGSSGRPLDTPLRKDMESRFGHDFSQVRVHLGGVAEQSTRDVNAQAYTVGNDIVFGAGQFAPLTQEGLQLIAHELTHVVQQNNERRILHRKVEVPSGVDVEFFSKNMQKTGDIYSTPLLSRDKGLDFEIFTSLFNSPRIFKLKGSTSKEIEFSFFRHMEARKGVIDFASNKKYGFVGGEAGFKMNPKYWEWGGGKFRSKAGVNLEEAREDLNVNPQEYAIGCAAATQLTVKAGGKSESIMDTTSEPKDWIPGEAGFIENKKWDGRPGLQGENIIYMGGKQFWGHFTSETGKAIKGYQEWFKQVDGWGAAELSQDRTYPEKGLKK